MKLKLTAQQRQLYQDIQDYDPKAATNYLRSIRDFQAGRPWSPPDYRLRVNHVSRRMAQRMQILRREEQWRLSEIAKHMNISPQAVRRHLSEEVERDND
ncbi:hypothetical protein PJF56_10635 [Roseofilum sp. BLCC_M91]|uniref:Uncharacterized protein n=1 Tax=Roseofilum halophilum BLCC-M91 TaxID=3022259 RepID=A0ABT7BJG1_9CYAN|nr:helix-turn-helix domain-containing protein [Roseofilum halophilum]MDJ1179321.1 hypothetical protein [Roseofilum halophilum BLCC-M91]